MSISSISNTSLATLYSQYIEKISTSKTSEDDYSDILSNYYESIQGISNSDGDTYTTGSVQNSLSLYSNSSDNLGLEIKSFLDKIEDGSVTQDDIDGMQTILQEAEENGTLLAPPPPPPSESVTSGQLSADAYTTYNISDIPKQISSFLDKVADGSVTQDDIDNLQSVLLEAKNNGMMQAPPPPPPDSSSSDQTDTDENSEYTYINEQIAAFLEKIKSGEITNNDLLSMQTLLQQEE